MRTVRMLATVLAVAALAACAESPTSAAAPSAAALESSSPLGQIVVLSTVDYGTYWRVHFSTATSSTIASRTWKHYGGTGANPWGNGAYKYIVDRTTPGCIAVELTTHYTDGGVSYDSESVNVGGYTGVCSVPW